MDFFPAIFYFLVIIPSAIMHEYAHGWMADQLGDPTARNAGRLSLDPRVHIDPIGTLLLPLMLFFGSGGSFMFAYAKPVPFNPNNLRDQRWGPVYVALAGPLTNFLIAFIIGIFVRLLPVSVFSDLLSVIVLANVLLGVFNCVPIPPLDGSKLLFAFFPASWQNIKIMMERFGFVLVLIFVFYFSHLINPIVEFFMGLFTGGNGLF
jgi:Zn-dependent protease